MNLLIKHARLLDPANQLDRVADLYISQGLISGIEKAPDGFSAEQQIDAQGLWAVPGLIDLLAHTRDPGMEAKGNIASESRAAIAGGITTLCCSPDTDPVIDAAATVELIHRRARDAGYADILPLGALTLGLKGEKLAEMYALKLAGCPAVSNAHFPVKDTSVLRKAFEYAATHELPVFLQAQDPYLSKQGCAHEGAVATRLGLTGIPVAAETLALARLLELVAITGVTAHFSKISSARGIHMIAAAKQQGLPITADTSINHLWLSEQDIVGYDANCHLMPPLRSETDREALRLALKDGVLDGICSDHQPHERDAKLAPFAQTQAGASSIELFLPLVLKLVDEGYLDLASALRSVTSNPASILGMPTGQLAVGKSADICLLQPDHAWEVDSATFISKGKNTPYQHWQMTSKVKQIIRAGRPLDF